MLPPFHGWSRAFAALFSAEVPPRVLSELRHSESGYGPDLHQVCVQSQRGGRTEIQGDDADDESARLRRSDRPGSACGSAPRSWRSACAVRRSSTAVCRTNAEQAQRDHGRGRADDGRLCASTVRWVCPFGWKSAGRPNSAAGHVCARWRSRACFRCASGCKLR